MNQKKLVLTDCQTEQCSRLVEKECANFSAGCCLKLDDGVKRRCLQLRSAYIVCQYFKSAVLPADKKLYKTILKKDADKIGERNIV